MSCSVMMIKNKKQNVMQHALLIQVCLYNNEYSCSSGAHSSPLSSPQSARRCVRGMFSATLPEGVESMANSVLQNAIRVVVGTRNAGASSIDQSLLFVGKEEVGHLQ